MRRRALYNLSLDRQEAWRQNMCLSKRRHATIEEATWALRALEQKGEQGLNIYPCPWCWGYHVGHGKAS